MYADKPAFKKYKIIERGARYLKGICTPSTKKKDKILRTYSQKTSLIHT